MITFYSPSDRFPAHRDGTFRMPQQPVRWGFYYMNSFYFTHDYNAANDSKVLFMRQQLGMEGYGIFWFIVEQLAQAGGFLPTKVIPVLAMQMQVTEAKVQAVINNYELFMLVDQNFYSERLNKHLEVRKQLSDAGRKGAEKKWLNARNDSHPISHPNSLPNSLPYGNKERKKESKEIKESRRFTPPTREDVIQHMMTKLDDFTAQGQADQFMNHYTSNGWKVGKNPMKDWKAAVNQWISRMKNYQPVEQNKPLKNLAL
jgi:hypothetical protein